MRLTDVLPFTMSMTFAISVLLFRLACFSLYENISLAMFHFIGVIIGSIRPLIFRSTCYVLWLYVDMPVDLFHFMTNVFLFRLACRRLPWKWHLWPACCYSGFSLYWQVSPELLHFSSNLQSSGNCFPSWSVSWLVDDPERGTHWFATKSNNSQLLIDVGGDVACRLVAHPSVFCKLMCICLYLEMLVSGIITYEMGGQVGMYSIDCFTKNNAYKMVESEGNVWG